MARAYPWMAAAAPIAVAARHPCSLLRARREGPRARIGY